MATQSYLPPALSDASIRELLESLHLSSPTSIRQLLVTAQFHSIYFINFPEEVADQLLPAKNRDPDGSITLVLRASGEYLPRIKTENEVAVMRWVQDNTSLPIPVVVRFDTSEKNMIGHEFTLLEKVPGVSIDTIYDTIDAAKKRYLVSQLVDFLDQLHAHSWTKIGGLRFSEEDEVVPGPVIDETFWAVPDVLKYWGPEESVSTLNVAGPYDTYTALCSAQLEKYMYAIRRHPSLEFMRDLLPRLNLFIDLLKDQDQVERLGLDNVKLVLAHKDLHFANVMCDPSTCTITGILDWEFSGIVNYARWNPSRAFLWNGKQTPEANKEKYELLEVFKEVCQERGITVLEDAKATPVQEALQNVVTYVRVVVEVCPRGEKLGLAREWRTTAEKALGVFGI